MKFGYILSVGIFLCLLSSCRYKPEKTVDVSDGGFLSGEPCSAPCFWNITPGITTEKQAMDELSSKLDVKSCDPRDSRNSGGTRGNLCSGISISFDDQSIVNMIGFDSSQKITVADVINKYGYPNGVSISILGIEMQPPVSFCSILIQRA